MTSARGDLQNLLHLKFALDQVALRLVLSQDGRILDVNEKLLRLLGMAEQDVVGKPLTEFFASQFLKTRLQPALETLSFGLVWRGELQFQCKSGADVWIDASFVPMEVESDPVRHQMIGFDVTERKSVETALQVNKNFQQALMDLAPAGIFLANAQGQCTYINNKWSELTGIRLRKALGDGWMRTIHPEDQRRVFQAWELMRKRGVPFSCEYRYQNPMGETKWVLATASTLQETAHPSFHYIRIEKDLTEHKKTQSLLEVQRHQLIMASKLSALGEMAGGIAHEINNPLAIIAARASLLKTRMNEKTFDLTWVHQSADVIESTSVRIAKIVRAMLNLVRKETGDQFVRTPARQMIEEAMALCSARFSRSSVTLDAGTANPQLEVDCRPVLVTQVLVNLLNNAFDAVTHSSSTDQKWVSLETREAGEFIEFCVTDGGAGIPLELKEKIFEPFFTTKDPGSGTGLGLSLSHSIARDHNGELYLEAECPHTRFVLKLRKKQDDSHQQAA